MYTGRIRENPEVISPCAADIKTILVIDLNAIEADVKQITVGRVQIQFEHETHWHGDWLILLEVRYLVGLGVKAPLHRDYLIISPSKQIRKLDRLCNVLYAVHGAWCDSERNSFLRCHQTIVKTDYDLA